MKPYILIQGTNDNIEEFEEKISTALNQGYEIDTELNTQVMTKPDGQQYVLLFQSMICEETLDFEDDDDASDDIDYEYE